MLVHGVSGIGKSALAHSLSCKVDRRSGLFVTGKYESVAMRQPFGAVGIALTQLFDVLLAKYPVWLERLCLRLSQRPWEEVEPLTWMMPALRSYDIGQRSTQPATEGSGHPSTARLAQSLIVFFEDLQEPARPIVLFFDDLQWAYANSLELIEKIASRQQGTQLLLIVAYREDEPNPSERGRDIIASLTRREGAIDIALTGVHQRAALELVAEALDAEPNDIATLATVLCEKTAGNPFFIRRHLEQLFGQGHLRRRGNFWRWSDEVLLKLPASANMVAQLLAEFKQLPRDDQRLAGACACMGAQGTVGLLACALGVTRLEASDRMRSLLAQKILVIAPAANEEEERVSFAHDRLHQAAYELLSDEEAAPSI